MSFRASLSPLRRPLHWLLVASLAALVHLLALGALYVKSSSVVIRLTNGREGSVRISCDRGRGFYIGDSLVAKVTAKAERVVETPSDTTRLRLQFSAEVADSEPMVSLYRDGRRIEQVCRWNEAGCAIDLRRYTPRVPWRVHAIVGALSVTIALGLATLSGALPTSAWAAWLAFCALSFALSHAGTAYRLLIHDIDKPPYWPISVFDLEQPGPAAALLGLLLLGAVAAPIALPRRAVTPRFGVLLVLATALLVGSNLLHGWTAGLVTPTASAPMYWVDALRIHSASEFLHTFNHEQLLLGVHSRTHPPGAVLVYYFLEQLFHDAALISLCLGLASFVGTGALIYRLLRSVTNASESSTAAALFLFLPAIQIYFVSCIDALVCLVFTAALYFAVRRKGVLDELALVGLLGISMLLSFGCLWLMATLVWFELQTRRSIQRVLVLTLGPVLCVLALKRLSGFDWLLALRTATLKENPDGFWLLANPGSYIFTRLEGVAELILFASPPFVLLWFRRVKAADHSNELVVLSRIGVTLLLLMFLTGAFKTGETARACAFVFPLLVFPLAKLAASAKGLELQRWLSLSLVAQTMLMQLFGNYYW